MSFLLIVAPAESTTWTKYSLFCNSYAYKGNVYFAASSVDSALQLCADDPDCAALAEWNCGDGIYTYCGREGYGLGYYGVGQCTSQKSFFPLCEGATAVIFSKSMRSRAPQIEYCSLDLRSSAITN